MGARREGCVAGAGAGSGAGQYRYRWQQEGMYKGTRVLVVGVRTPRARQPRRHTAWRMETDRLRRSTVNERRSLDARWAGWECTRWMRAVGKAGRVVQRRACRAVPPSQIAHVPPLATPKRRASHTVGKELSACCTPWGQTMRNGKSLRILLCCMYAPRPSPCPLAFRLPARSRSWRPAPAAPLLPRRCRCPSLLLPCCPLARG